MYPPYFPTLSPLPQRLAAILGDVCRAVAARGGRDHSLETLVRLTWARLIGTVMRLERLVLRLAAGRPARARRTGLTRRPCVRADAGAFRLPRGFLWLVVKMPETASLASQVRHLLDDPEMAALLAAEPAAARILRPMCRMLGIAHPAVGVREPASAGAPVMRRKKVAARLAPPWPPAAPEPAPASPARWVVFRRSD